MGAAWRDVGNKKSGFDKVLQMVRQVSADRKVSCTDVAIITPAP
jgi:hypothetical protein